MIEAILYGMFCGLIYLVGYKNGRDEERRRNIIR